MDDLEEKQDLPLMSNVDEILVRHYDLNFACDFKSKRFTCTATLFLEPVLKGIDGSCVCSRNKYTTTAGNGSDGNLHLYNSSDRLHSEDKTAENEDPFHLDNLGFVVVLDCHQIEVREVVALDILKEDSNFPGHKPVATPEKLKFHTSVWALKIWRGPDTCRFCFPKAIRVSYETVASCPSLLWVDDQLGKPAVFTFGAYVNNRSLLPCQEPPVAMATWEAVVTVTDSATVVMSGDEEPAVTVGEGFTRYSFHCKKPLPMSTLCLAVGFWEEYAIHSHLKFGCKCRIFACPNLFGKSIQELSNYIPECIVEIEKLLGAYPFPRIDFVIVPPTFGSLGMASPNVVFLSQSLLCEGDSSLVSRVSHEVCHGWFGLSIGALDWTEEWLSEGFATFMEDIVHARTIQMPTSDVADFLELKAFLRKQILSYEVENTKEELQVLRPSQGKANTIRIEGVNATVLKNGQNPQKNFMQVHYIKGYFLLRYLCDIVGIDSFLSILRTYVSAFEGRLVTSQEFFTFLFDASPELKNSQSLESIYENWLHNVGMPPEIENFKPLPSNRLYTQVSEETAKWKQLNRTFSRRKAKRKKWDPDSFATLMPEQTVLLLENLLEERKLNSQTLVSLDKVLGLKVANAEVQHRWFELVVKYRMKSEYTDLEGFLVNHLALGVYLYGEMLHSGNADLRRIAEECFERLRPQLEPNYRSTIEGMIRD